MCDSCGCSQPDNSVTIRRAGQNVSGSANHHHAPHHHHDRPVQGRIVEVREAVLGKNDALAAHNREFFKNRRVVALNLVSSPGSGKTTILERTIRALLGEIPMAVIEGDQQTMLDAERIDISSLTRTEQPIRFSMSLI